MIRDAQFSKRTRIRLEGVKELGVLVARKNPVVDNVLTAKEAYDSAYKLANGKRPPSMTSEFKKLPGHIRQAEKMK